MATYLSGDFHFGHANIIWMCKRPFRDVHEMNQGLIENYNAVVGPEDDCYILGDFAMKVRDHEYETFFNALNGRKHLILGNHDLDKKGNIKKAISRLPWSSEPTHMREIRHEGRRIFLYHYAQLTWNSAMRGSLLAFGHSHGKLPGLPGSIDVGVDQQNYRPISVEGFIRQADATRENAVEQTEKVIEVLRRRLRPSA